MSTSAWLTLGLALAVAPILPGLAHRTKSLLTGRRGTPILQLYRDLVKLGRKGSVYSRTVTWAFRAGPVVFFATALLAAGLMPFDGRSAPLRFAGDFVALTGLLALGRFALVLAALDTGSSFEGMGASREATFGSLSEPGLFLCFAALTLATGDLSLSGMLGPGLQAHWATGGPALAMVTGGLFLLSLAENGRVPVDDPTTHLELTMIHEVMVLDHGGPDFALIQYASALKLVVFGTLLVNVLLPRAMWSPGAGIALWLGGLAGVAVAIGVVESVMARMRLSRVPHLLVAAAVLPAFGIILFLSSTP